MVVAAYQLPGHPGDGVSPVAGVFFFLQLRILADLDPVYRVVFLPQLYNTGHQIVGRAVGLSVLAFAVCPDLFRLFFAGAVFSGHLSGFLHLPPPDDQDIRLPLYPVIIRVSKDDFGVFHQFTGHFAFCRFSCLPVFIHVEVDGAGTVHRAGSKRFSGFRFQPAALDHSFYLV